MVRERVGPDDQEANLSDRERPQQIDEVPVHPDAARAAPIVPLTIATPAIRVRPRASGASTRRRADRRRGWTRIAAPSRSAEVDPSPAEYSETPLCDPSWDAFEPIGGDHAGEVGFRSPSKVLPSMATASRTPRLFDGDDPDPLCRQPQRRERSHSLPSLLACLPLAAVSTRRHSNAGRTRHGRVRPPGAEGAANAEVG